MTPVDPDPLTADAPPSGSTVALGGGAVAPYPTPVDEAASKVGRGNRRSDTKPERALRSELHRRGRRFRKDHPIAAGSVRVRPDMVFTKVEWRSSSTAASGTAVRSMGASRGRTARTGFRSCDATSSEIAQWTMGSRPQDGWWCVSGSTSRLLRQLTDSNLCSTSGTRNLTPDVLHRLTAADPSAFFPQHDDREEPCR